MRLKNALLFDPSHGVCGLGWVQIVHGLVDGWGYGTAPFADGLDCEGKLLSPGFVDTHVHFREPGGEHKETIGSGLAAALRGGYTAVVAMANTNPPVDCAHALLSGLRAAAGAGCRYYQAAAVTEGLKGKSLTDFRTLKSAGAVCLSDDGSPIVSDLLARRAYVQAKDLGLRISVHPENPQWSGDRSMHRGVLSERLGLVGVDPCAEDDHIQRDLDLALETGGAVMVQHVSTARGCNAIRRAKARGVNVTAEATPHHMTLTVEEVMRSGTNAKMSPPLRPEEDRCAVLAAFLDGTLDCLSTDHAPHAPQEKALGMAQAPNGIIGLETAFAVVWAAVRPWGSAGLRRLIEGLTSAPRKALNLPDVGLFVGSTADLTLTDLNRPWVADATRFASKGRNCPWDGAFFVGRPVMTLVEGAEVWSLGC